MVSALSLLSEEETKQAMDFASKEGRPFELVESAFLNWSKPEVRAVVILRAFSVPLGLVAECFPTVSEKAVDNCLQNCPKAEETFVKYSLKIKQMEGDGAHTRLLPIALMVQEQILTSSKVKESDKSRIASEVIDRVKGKPVQRMETKSFNLTATADLEEQKKGLDVVTKRIGALEQRRNEILAARQAKEQQAEVEVCDD